MGKVTEELSYDHLQRIGKGSSGTIVFRGTFNEEQVAVKKMDTDQMKMIDREVSLLKLGEKHENIVNYYCTEVKDEHSYIALEICDLDASKYFYKGDNPEQSEFLNQLRIDFHLKDILKQTTEGIVFLHSIQIIHRDIKPQNILLKKTVDGWKIKISDFGISKILNFNNTSTLLTNSINPQAFVAPEMLNDKKSSKSSDIYSLGCFFYYMQSGGSFDLFKIQKNDAGRFGVQYDGTTISTFKKSDDGALCIDLVKEMCDLDPKHRLSAEMVLEHAYFWNSQKKFEFLKDLNTILNCQTNDLKLNKFKEVLNFSTHVDSIDWSKELDDMLIKDIEKKKRYFKLDCVTDLINYIQMKSEHAKEPDSELREIFGNSNESFLKYWTQKFPFLLMLTFMVCTAKLKFLKDEIFTSKYLTFKSTYEKRFGAEKTIFKHLNNQPENIKQMVYTNFGNYYFENCRITLKHLLHSLKAFSFPCLHLKNVGFSDKETFSQSIDQSFSDLKEIIIENSDSFFELLTNTKSLENVTFNMERMRNEDIKRFVDLLTQQPRLKMLFCPGGFTKLLVHHKLPFQLQTMLLNGHYNESISTDLPRSIITFVRTQKYLQTLQISLPGNFQQCDVRELFESLDQVKHLKLVCESSQELPSYLQGCSSNVLELLHLKFHRVNFDPKHFATTMNQFPKLLTFECSDNRGVFYFKERRDFESIMTETLWFTIPILLDLEILKLKTLENCRVGLNLCDEIPPSFKKFILKNSNIKHFEIHYINSIPQVIGIPVQFFQNGDKLVIELVDIILQELKDLKTLKLYSMVPIPNKKFFENSFEKYTMLKKLEKFELFEKLLASKDYKINISYNNIQNVPVDNVLLTY